jgi:hypothetical protein
VHGVPLATQVIDARLTGVAGTVNPGAFGTSSTAVEMGSWLSAVGVTATCTWIGLERSSGSTDDNETYSMGVSDASTVVSAGRRRCNNAGLPPGAVVVTITVTRETAPIAGGMVIDCEVMPASVRAGRATLVAVVVDGVTVMLADPVVGMDVGTTAAGIGAVAALPPEHAVTRVAAPMAASTQENGDRAVISRARNERVGRSADVVCTSPRYTRSASATA